MTNEEFENKCLGLFKRLRNRYLKKHDFNCICECYDATICKLGSHTVDVWENDSMIKCLYDNELNYVTFERYFCPICDRPISIKGRTKTNGLRVI